MANLKLWQSLGISGMFALAQLNSIRVSVVVLIASLALSSIALLWVHLRVANFDSGKMPETRAVSASREGREA